MKKYYMRYAQCIDDINNQKCFENDYVRIRYKNTTIEGKIKKFNSCFLVIDLKNKLETININDIVRLQKLSKKKKTETLNTESWINDMTYTCDFCGQSFRVYFKEDESTEFCPSCGGTDFTYCDED